MNVCFGADKSIPPGFSYCAKNIQIYFKHPHCLLLLIQIGISSRCDSGLDELVFTLNSFEARFGLNTRIPRPRWEKLGRLLVKTLRSPVLMPRTSIVGQPGRSCRVSYFYLHAGEASSIYLFISILPCGSITIVAKCSITASVTMLHNCKQIASNSW